MKKALLASLIVAALLASKAGYTEPVRLSLAQPAAASPVPEQPSPVPPESRTDQLFVLRPTQILTIGAGVISGAVIVEALFATDVGVLVGGILGGYMANIWYGGHQIEIHLGTPPRI